MNVPGLNERQPRLDWLLLFGLLGLMVVGTLFIYSATLAQEANTIPWYRERFFMQIVWYALGAIAAGTLCLLDYSALARWSVLAYWGTILLWWRC